MKKNRYREMMAERYCEMIRKADNPLEKAIELEEEVAEIVKPPKKKKKKEKK